MAMFQDDSPFQDITHRRNQQKQPSRQSRGVFDTYTPKTSDANRLRRLQSPQQRSKPHRNQFAPAPAQQPRDPLFDDSQSLPADILAKYCPHAVARHPPASHFRSNSDLANGASDFSRFLSNEPSPKAVSNHSGTGKPPLSSKNKSLRKQSNYNSNFAPRGERPLLSRSFSSDQTVVIGRDGMHSNDSNIWSNHKNYNNYNYSNNSMNWSQNGLNTNSFRLQHIPFDYCIRSHIVCFSDASLACFANIPKQIETLAMLPDALDPEQFHFLLSPDARDGPNCEQSFITSHSNKKRKISKKNTSPAAAGLRGAECWQSKQYLQYRFVSALKYYKYPSDAWDGSDFSNVHQHYLRHRDQLGPLFARAADSSANRPKNANSGSNSKSSNNNNNNNNNSNNSKNNSSSTFAKNNSNFGASNKLFTRYRRRVACWIEAFESLFNVFICDYSNKLQQSRGSQTTHTIAHNYFYVRFEPHYNILFTDAKYHLRAGNLQNLQKSFENDLLPSYLQEQEEASDTSDEDMEQNSKNGKNNKNTKKSKKRSKSGNNEANRPIAIISNASRKLQEELKQRGIQFKMPLIRAKTKSLGSPPRNGSNSNSSGSSGSSGSGDSSRRSGGTGGDDGDLSDAVGEEDEDIDVDVGDLERSGLKMRLNRKRSVIQSKNSSSVRKKGSNQNGTDTTRRNMQRDESISCVLIEGVVSIRKFANYLMSRLPETLLTKKQCVECPKLASVRQFRHGTLCAVRVDKNVAARLDVPSSGFNGTNARGREEMGQMGRMGWISGKKRKRSEIDANGTNGMNGVNQVMRYTLELSSECILPTNWFEIVRILNDVRMRDKSAAGGDKKRFLEVKCALDCLGFGVDQSIAEALGKNSSGKDDEMNGTKTKENGIFESLNDLERDRVEREGTDGKVRYRHWMGTKRIRCDGDGFVVQLEQ